MSVNADAPPGTLVVAVTGEQRQFRCRPVTRGPGPLRADGVAGRVGAVPLRVDDVEIGGRVEQVRDPVIVVVEGFSIVLPSQPYCRLVCSRFTQGAPELGFPVGAEFDQQLRRLADADLPGGLPQQVVLVVGRVVERGAMTPPGRARPAGTGSASCSSRRGAGPIGLGAEATVRHSPAVAIGIIRRRTVGAQPEYGLQVAPILKTPGAQ